MINLNTPTKLLTKLKWYWLVKILILILLPAIFWRPLFWILTIFFGLPIYIYLLLFYNSISFTVEENKITINEGVIIKKSKSIPFNMVQNVENIKGILHRIFGLSTVKIWTASPEQIRTYKGQTEHKPDGILDLIAEDGDWLKNFILNKK